jgi:hypothetical protein
VLPSLLAGKHVIKREIGAYDATILAGVAVPDKDLFSGEAGLRRRALDHVKQPNDGRNGVGGSEGAQVPATVLQEFGLSLAHEHYGPPNVAHV